MLHVCVGETSLLHLTLWTEISMETMWPFETLIHVSVVYSTAKSVSCFLTAWRVKCNNLPWKEFTCMWSTSWWPELTLVLVNSVRWECPCMQACCNRIRAYSVCKSVWVQLEEAHVSVCLVLLAAVSSNDLFIWLSSVYPMPYGDLLQSRIFGDVGTCVCMLVQCISKLGHD